MELYLNILFVVEYQKLIINKVKDINCLNGK